jgi:uncharacterized protein (TIGR00661 family)
MGHATRTSVVAEHLIQQGHEILFASSRGALRHLRKRWPAQTMQIPTLGFSMSRNKVSPLLSVLSNALRQIHVPQPSVEAMMRMGAFAPDVVISDFEPFTARYATASNTPCVSVDHIHFVNRCAHPPDCMARDRAAAAIAYPLVDNMVPNAQRYLIVTFADARVIRENTTLHLPTIRPAIMPYRQRTTEGSHVVMYFNDKYNHAAMMRELTQLRTVDFHLYGVPGLSAEQRQGNVLLRPFSEEGFFDDMASCGAIIGGAGFNFMSEAIYLGKPMLAMPFEAHYEQILNANYLQGLGYGERCCAFTADAVSGFLCRSAEYRRNLRNFYHDNNAELLASVDRALVDVVGARG